MSADRREGASQNSADRSQRLLRSVAVGVAGLFLMSTAYQASFASQTLFQGPVASSHGYSHDDDEGLSTGEQVAIGAGAAAAIGVGAGVLGGGAGILGGVLGGAAAASFPMGSDREIKERLPELPADHTQLTDIRLVPATNRLETGRCTAFFLEVKSGHDGKWYSVTKRDETVIDLPEPAEGLVKQDGSKNVFCVPMTVPASVNGQSYRVRGSFALPGQNPMLAETTIQVRVRSITE